MYILVLSGRSLKYICKMLIYERNPKLEKKFDEVFRLYIPLYGCHCCNLLYV